jgi:hypothetical protein
MRPGGIRRAAQWDGWIVVAMSEDGASMALGAHDLAERLAIFRTAREGLGRAGEPADVAVLGVAGTADGPAAFEGAGATWWLESLSPMRGSVEALEAIVRAGPPR